MLFWVDLAPNSFSASFFAPSMCVQNPSNWHNHWRYRRDKLAGGCVSDIVAANGKRTTLQTKAREWRLLAGKVDIMTKICITVDVNAACFMAYYLLPMDNGKFSAMFETKGFKGGARPC